VVEFLKREKKRFAELRFCGKWIYAWGSKA
jgi:hypothetical protein